MKTEDRLDELAAKHVAEDCLVMLTLSDMRALLARIVDIESRIAKLEKP